MAMASKEEVLDLYTRIIRGEEVDSVTLQAAKALARHYGIDTPSDEPQCGDVIIVDDIGRSSKLRDERILQKAVKTALEGADDYAGGDSVKFSAYCDGVNALHSIYAAALKATEK